MQESCRCVPVLQLAGPRGPSCEVDDRDARVLNELARDAEARVAFTGLKRRLGVHQQVLTRALRRLEDAGWVQRDGAGYRLTEAGYACLKGRALPAVPAEKISVVQAILPPHAELSAVADRLSARWFSGLRWYGRAEAPGETTLTWLTERNDVTVRLRLSGHAASVEVEVPAGGEEAAYAAIRPLLSALADVYAAPARPRPAGPAAPMAPAADIRGMAG